MENIKILVPLDFSDLSIRALKAAKNLVRIFNGTITSFHSYLPMNEMDGPYMLGLGPAPIEDFEEMGAMLGERIGEIASEHIDSEYLNDPVISIGNPAQSIVEEAENYDIIAMSTHGRTGFSRFFLGSVTEKVLRISHIPVLVVGKESEIKPIKRILVTTDFSENSHAAFPYVIDVAKTIDADVELVHIMTYDEHYNEKPSESKISLREQRLNVLAKEELHEINERIRTKVIVSPDAPHEAILKYDNENPHDLIIMARIGRTGIKYLMMGSTTAHVIRHVKAPVLSINPKQKEKEIIETE